MYCHNDLQVTRILYDELKPQIALREQMSKQYGLDLRSNSDAQIAENVIKHELEAKDIDCTRPTVKIGTNTNTPRLSTLHSKARYLMTWWR
jgi:hypothetical protein